MAVGNVVEDLQNVEVGKYLKIQPAIDAEEWVVHNVYHEVDVQLIKSKLYSITGENVGTGDGSTTQFTLAHIPVEEYSEIIYLDGVEQTRGTDYTIDYETGMITFSTAPSSGVAITADYQYRMELVVDSRTGPGSWLGFAFHVKKDSYYRVKNVGASAGKIGYDGVVTKA